MVHLIVVPERLNVVRDLIKIGADINLAVNGEYEQPCSIVSRQSERS